MYCKLVMYVLKKTSINKKKKKKKKNGDQASLRRHS